MSEDPNGVADRTSGDIPGVNIGVPCEREGLLCPDIAGLGVGEEVARAEDGLWVVPIGGSATEQVLFDSFWLP